MENSEEVLTIQWTKRDFIEALEKEGINPNEENISKITSYQNLKFLEEQSIVRGWEFLRERIISRFHEEHTYSCG